MITAQQKYIAGAILAAAAGGITGALQLALPESNGKTAIETEFAPLNLPNSTPTLNAYEALSQRYRQISTAVTQTDGQSGVNNAKPWHLQGIVEQKGQRYALIESSAQNRRYQIGEVLSDNAKLIAINNSSVDIEFAGKTVTVNLYSAPPSEAASAPPASHASWKDSNRQEERRQREARREAMKKQRNQNNSNIAESRPIRSPSANTPARTFDREAIKPH